MLLKLPLLRSSSRWLAGFGEWWSANRTSVVPNKVGEVHCWDAATAGVSFKSCLTQRSIHTQTGSCGMSGLYRVYSGESTSTPRQLQILPRRTYGRHATTTSGLNETLNPTEAAKRKAAGKSAEPEKILLMSETENISVSTLADAEKLARKKGFQLVEVTAAESKLHSDKKVYKFQTQAQHFGNDWKHKHESSIPDKDKKDQTRKKEDKTVLFKSKISVHDLEAKVKQMNKLLEKGHAIRVFIGSAGSTGDPEFVFRGIQSNLTRACKIQQKKNTGAEIRFQILPVTIDPESDAGATDAAVGGDTTPKSKTPKNTKESPPPPSSASEALT